MDADQNDNQIQTVNPTETENIDKKNDNEQNKKEALKLLSKKVGRNQSDQVEEKEIKRIQIDKKDLPTLVDNSKKDTIISTTNIITPLDSSNQTISCLVNIEKNNNIEIDKESIKLNSNENIINTNLTQEDNSNELSKDHFSFINNKQDERVDSNQQEPNKHNYKIEESLKETHMEPPVEIPKEPTNEIPKEIKEPTNEISKEIPKETHKEPPVEIPKETHNETLKELPLNESLKETPKETTSQNENIIQVEQKNNINIVNIDVQENKQNNIHGTHSPSQIITNNIQSKPSEQVPSKKISFAVAKKEIDEFTVQIESILIEIKEKYGVSIIDNSYEDILPDELKIKLIEDFFNDKDIQELSKKS